MSTGLWHPEEVCAVHRSRSAWTESKKSLPQNSQRWHEPLISNKLKTWWKQGEGIQIVLLFAIVEEPVFKLPSVQQNSRRFPFFSRFLCSAKSIFLLKSFFFFSQQNGDIFLRTNDLVYLYTPNNRQYNYVYQNTLNCWVTYIWISVAYWSHKAEARPFSKHRQF